MSRIVKVKATATATGTPRTMPTPYGRSAANWLRTAATALDRCDLAGFKAAALGLRGAGLCLTATPAHDDTTDEESDR